ncbi:MAG: hypothetical protein COA65_05335 [Rhodospirillaceae bacterium]|nr:MAG: hypothetical protein COA65_05335 [Rhodospirillaceae bacterium]
MTLHLVKMAVGVKSIDHLAAVQSRRMPVDGKPLHVRTRNMPRRADAILDGGSIYWVIKGYIRARQRILGLDRKTDAEGRSYCEIRLDRELVKTQLIPRKPQQGWRYLEEAGAPGDLSSGDMDASLPPEMAAELRELGLL